jgi:hypothetical protein
VNTKAKILVVAALAALASFGAIPKAQACGCFAPPDPSVPIVQAGERILFVMDQGQVTAHVQIQYSGAASDFGWLLPLPSVPTLDLGVDELFNQLITSTQPKYKLNRVYEGNCSFNPSRGGGGFAGANPVANGAGGEDTSGAAPHSPLVIQDSIGPYDYAVLRADSKDAMLKWLNDNHYFVPAGTDGAVDPYIHPGAFFLALKLKSGNSAGDLQPVVIKYASDLPMIPLVLTSVGAKPDMGIQVWMLGQGRAIPRNYYHTVINDAVLDWNNGSANYEDVIIRATKEAPARHTFVTEYAGTSGVMKNLLNAPGRFGSNAELANQPDAVSFVQYLYSHGYGTLNNNLGGGPVANFGYQLSSQLLAVLQKYIPVPPALAQKGITAQVFYQDLSYYLTTDQQQNPGDFAGWTMNYQPAMMAQEIATRVVAPTLAAGALFDNSPYLTRLYTTLSPENMDKDPVFSFNVGLPDWNNEHDGTLTYHCGLFSSSSSSSNTSATLVTAEGWAINYPYGVGTKFTAPNLPASLRIEILAEEGSPQVVTDNSGQIKNSVGGGSGCSYSGSAIDTGWWMLGGLLLVAGALVRRREQA